MATALADFDPAEERMIRAILRAVKFIHDETSVAMIQMALEVGDIEGALDALKFEIGEHELASIIPGQLRDAYETSAFEQVKTLGKSGLKIRFDIVNPAAVEFVRESAASLIKEFGESSLQAIRDLISRAMGGQLSPYKLAKQIRETGIGLTSRQLLALDNFRMGLQTSGMAQERIERMMARAYTKALRYRSQMIARTEIIRASREGSQAAWEHAVEQGLIDPGKAVQRWNTAGDERECDICAPLDGETARLGEEFPNGGGFGPPPHPNCRCSLSLLPFGV